MKESTKKAISSIITFLQGGIFGAFIVLFSFDLKLKSLKVLDIITLAAMVAIVIATPFLTRLAKKIYDKNHTKVIDFPGQENQIKYNSPFPEIDQNPAQSAMIQVYIDFLASKYHVQGMTELEHGIHNPSIV